MVTVHEPVRVDQQEVRATISGPLGTDDIWFRSTLPLTPATEAWASLGLHLAMASGQPLKCHTPVSRRWYENQRRIQEILTTWYPGRHLVPVYAPVIDRVEGPERGAASFFSGGVDSFSSALEVRDRSLTALLMVQGLDILLSQTAFWERVAARLEQAAVGLNLKLVRIATNVRQALDRAGDYSTITHGAALASVALVHQRCFDKVYIPSSHHYRDLFPWGSHPLLDPLWGTEALTIEQDGGHLTRLAKTARIAANPIALGALRVCYMKGGAYNCGRCEKCIRTQCALLICAAPQLATFETPLKLERVLELYPRDENTAAFVREMIAAGDPADPLVRFLTDVLWRYDGSDCRHRVATFINRTTAQGIWRWLGDRMRPGRRRYI